MDQRGQTVDTQTNIVHMAAARPPEPGRIVGRMPPRAASFTGREDVLGALHAALGTGDAALAAPPHALNGMPGLGKTRTAVEYAHLYWKEYTTVAWVLADSPEALRANLAGLAGELGLALPDGTPQDGALAAVRHWFATHQGWLLIADNVEEPRDLHDALPPAAPGRVLMTTRREDPGEGVTPIRLKRLDAETGALLLLRRAGHLKPDGSLDEAETEWRMGALAVSRRFDGLPLALEHAGAYVASGKGTPWDYLRLYDARRTALLAVGVPEDQRTIMVTFALALERVEAVARYGPAAAQLVRLCAFLAPDAIPEAVFRGERTMLEEPLRSLAEDDLHWPEVVEAATRYALLARDPDGRSLSLHRLVADVVRDGMDPEARRAGTLAAVRALNAAFPAVEYGTWDVCARLLPHVLALREAVSREGIIDPGASRMLGRVANYLWRQGKYMQSEPIFQEALLMCRALYGNYHREVATALNNLGVLLGSLGQRGEAATALEEAVAIDERLSDADDYDIAVHLDNLGTTYYHLSRYAEAATHHRQAITLMEKQCGSDSPSVATCLNNLALALSAMGEFSEAQALRERDLQIKRVALGERHPDYAISLSNIGMLHMQAGQWNEAERPLKEALQLRDAIYEGAHPDCAGPRLLLGQLFYLRSDLESARVYMAEALAIWERFLPPDHPDTADTREILSRIDAAITAGGEAAGGGGSGGTGDGARR